MPNPKAWRYNDPKAQSYPSDYEILERATLQKTDLKDNNNKYYGLELHKASSGLNQWRVFTHYGRTGDLANKPNAGVKECRFFSEEDAARREYKRLYTSKTGKSKGYVELSLASSNIGSDKARGMSSGHVDDKTKEKIEVKSGKPKAPKPVNLCPSGLRGLISLIYDEATSALTSTVQAKITAKGIETPLGVLTVGQIELGETILKQIYDAVKASEKAKELEALSSRFYTAVPHKLGRAKASVQAAVIDSKAKVSEKEEILQLMRDMLKVDGEESVLHSDALGDKYRALGCEITQMAHTSAEFTKWKKFVLDSRVKRHRSMNIKNVYSVSRPGEAEKFNEAVGNIKLLFHGSRIRNWVGLLTRGTLMPKLVVAMGGNRTDGGWLGNGIYFGDAACTSSFYTSSGKGGHRIMTIHQVALGKMKEFKRITYGMNEPPSGFQSCHGNPRGGSQFADDEFCIYAENQQAMSYLVEFTT